MRVPVPTRLEGYPRVRVSVDARRVFAACHRITAGKTPQENTVTNLNASGARTNGSVDELTTVQLVERLQAQLSTLVRAEIGNALDEVKAKGTQVGIGVGMSGAGIML